MGTPTQTSLTQAIKRVPLGLWLVAGLGLALRAFQLNRDGLWNDEAFSVMAASQPFTQMFAEIVRDGVHPPAFYLYLHPWISLFGNSEIAVRSLSVLFGVLSIGLIYVLAKRLYGAQTALMATFLLAVSSFHIFYSQEARMYIFMAPPALASFYFLHRLMEGRNLKLYAGYIISSVIFLYTHIYAVFFIVAQNLYYLCLLLFAPPDKRVKLSDWVVVQGLTVIAFLPWLPLVFGKAEQQRGSFWLGAPDASALFQLAQSFVGSGFGLAVITLFLILGAIVLARRDQSYVRRLWTHSAFTREGFLLIWMLAPLIITYLYSWAVEPILYPRYALPASLPLYILLGAALVSITHRFPKWKLAVFACVGILSAYQLYLYYSDVRMNRYRLPHDWRAAAAYLGERAGAGDTIICPGACHAFEYYLNAMGLEKQRVAILRRDDKALTRRVQRLKKLATQGERVWYVWQEGRDAQGLARQALSEDHTHIESQSFVLLEAFPVHVYFYEKNAR